MAEKQIRINWDPSSVISVMLEGGIRLRGLVQILEGKHLINMSVADELGVEVEKNSTKLIPAEGEETFSINDEDREAVKLMARIYFDGLRGQEKIYQWISAGDDVGT